jgi:peptidoglycan/xylan/chitin deacetylase (PgdA/CDA1 family)
MGILLIRIVAVTLSVGLLTGCKTTGDKDKTSKSGGFFGKKRKTARNGLGDPSWGDDVNSTINGARGKLDGFDPNSAPRRNPDFHIPVDPARARALTYSRVKVGGPYIAMTFDDGPHPTNTPRLLDILKRRNIRATFFVVGTNARRYPAIMRRMVAEGHEVGNHTVNHPHITKISHEKAVAEVRGCAEAIHTACGVRPRLFRPPGGYINSRQKIWLKDDFGYSTIMWAVDPQDWRRPGSNVVAQRIINDTDAGEIVLAHDIHSPTITAMPRALDGLLAKGLRFVTVSQLIAMERNNVAGTGEKVLDPKPIPTPNPLTGTAAADDE